MFSFIQSVGFRSASASGSGLHDEGLAPNESDLIYCTMQMVFIFRLVASNSSSGLLSLRSDLMTLFEDVAYSGFQRRKKKRRNNSNSDGFYEDFDDEDADDYNYDLREEADIAAFFSKISNYSGEKSGKKVFKFVSISFYLYP